MEIVLTCLASIQVI